MDEHWGHCTKWNKPATEWKMFYDSTYMRYQEQSNSYRHKVNGGCQALGGGETEELFDDYKVSVEVLEIGGPNGCRTMWMYLSP